MNQIMKSKTISQLALLYPILAQGVENAILKDAAQKSVEANKWFDFESIDYSIKALSIWMKEENLTDFASRYTFTNKPKTIAVICAGNIPLVGFHDMLCVLLSGHIFYGKLSSDDKFLLPAIAEILFEIDSEFKNRIFFTEGKIEGFDAVIATGSNNTSRYFEYYFGKYPNIIRHSRTSVAVLDGNEKNIDKLAIDILTHKGLGCRNVSKLFIPKGYNFKELVLSFEKFNFLLDHNKYRNNYDYHKTIYIMNTIPFIDTTNCILLENQELFSPVSVVYYEYYDNIEDVKARLDLFKENIQCVVSEIKEIENSIPLGKAQEPTIFDFADNIDTMRFLNSL